MSRWRMAVILTAVVCTTFALVAMAQETAMPKPGAEHKAMGVFAGKWKFEGEAKESPMGPGGKITFTESCEWFEGGFALVCRSQGTGPMGSTNSLSIMSYSTEKNAYTYYVVESNMPPFMAMGQRDGKTWNWETASQMGDKTLTTRVTIIETSPTTYTFEMKISTDGSTWTEVITGKSTKSST